MGHSPELWDLVMQKGMLSMANTEVQADYYMHAAELEKVC